MVDEAGYGVGLSYRPAKLLRLADRYNNPALVSSPQSGTQNWASGSRTKVKKISKELDFSQKNTLLYTF
jgi:hypothetical protein